MKTLINLIIDRPLIIFASLGIAFYLNMLRLLILQNKRKRAYKTIQDMKDSGTLSKVFLKINDGKGDFYDIRIKHADRNDDEDLPLLSDNQVLTPALLLPEGFYTVSFMVKVYEFPTGYISGKGPFSCKITVHQNEDSMLVFDTDTLSGYQEVLHDKFK